MQDFYPCQNFLQFQELKPQIKRQLGGFGIIDECGLIVFKPKTLEREPEVVFVVQILCKQHGFESK
jgi:hypothetical protein